MTLLALFWNEEEERPRFLVRVVLACAAVVLGLIPVALLAGATGTHVLKDVSSDYDLVINLMTAPLMTAGILAAVFFTARFVDRRPLSDLGFTRRKDAAMDALVGFAVGGVVMLFVFLVELAAGWIHITRGVGVLGAGGSLLLAVAFVLAKNVCVGVTEETLVRGYLLRNLTESLGFTTWSLRGRVRAAVILSSLIFGAQHFLNPHFSLAAFVGLTVNGLLLATAFLATGSLAFPMALHAAWNLFQGSVFAFPVSGEREPVSLIVTQLGGPALPTGGAFGPEAGLVGIAASLLGIVLVLAYTRGRRK